LPLSVAFDLSRCSAQNVKIPAPLVCFEIYVAPIKVIFHATERRFEILDRTAKKQASR